MIILQILIALGLFWTLAVYITHLTMSLDKEYGEEKKYLHLFKFLQLFKEKKWTTNPYPGWEGEFDFTMLFFIKIYSLYEVGNCGNKFHAGLIIIDKVSHVTDPLTFIFISGYLLFKQIERKVNEKKII